MFFRDTGILLLDMLQQKEPEVRPRYSILPRATCAPGCHPSRGGPGARLRKGSGPAKLRRKVEKLRGGTLRGLYKELKGPGVGVEAATGFMLLKGGLGPNTDPCQFR